MFYCNFIDTLKYIIYTQTAQDIHWTSRLGFNLVQTSMDLVRMF